jgi:hypothetical protein
MTAPGVPFLVGPSSEHLSPVLGRKVHPHSAMLPLVKVESAINGVLPVGKARLRAFRTHRIMLSFLIVNRDASSKARFSSKPLTANPEIPQSNRLYNEEV